ncbi:MAG: hypothetical protein MUE94_03075 [Verrucomicrobia bacterium]|jgi:hypothetical protein|nr:hypothetical protein [Verrucomicrobiota bacterium]
MNSFRHLRPILALALLLGAATAARPQMLPSPASSGLDAALMRLFGEHKAFSGEAVIRVYDKTEQEILSTTMGLAVRDGQVRMEVDLSRLKSKDLPASVAGNLEQLGMEKVVSLILPEKRASYLVYPGLQAILKVPMDEKVLKAADGGFQVKRVEIGRETLDRLACTKYRVTVTDSSGGTQEAITWNAPEWKDFPVQIQMADGDNLMILRFRNVTRAPPKAESFALPDGYTHYDSQPALLQAVLMKALGGLGQPPAP